MPADEVRARFAQYLDGMLVHPDRASVTLNVRPAGTALAVADRVYCFQHGRVSLSGRAADLTRAQISSAYFGL